MRRTILVCCILVLAAVAFSQQPPTAQSPAAQQPAAAPASANPLSDFNRLAYKNLKDWVLRSAERTPEEHFAFKPAETVRSFGQMLGHIADAQYLFCGVALGEKAPRPGIEKSKTTKADLISALSEAFAYCDKAYDGMTDTSGVAIVNLFGHTMPKHSVLSANAMHVSEHYGNLVTYMRMKNVLPPSSERNAAPAAKK